MRSDICLILEGTYPYVSGGVSTWIAQILEAMPQFHFSVLYIGPRSDKPREFKYKIPPNLHLIREVFVHDMPRIEPKQIDDTVLDQSQWETIAKATQALTQGDALDLPALLEVLETFPDDASLVQSLAHSRQSWQLVVDQYNRLAPESSFLDYFWTHRFINLPLMRLLRTEMPVARIYHTACTGYAGILGAKGALMHGEPLLISEHGIYTRERRIEIFNAEWITQDNTEGGALDLGRKENYFKEWWVKFFLGMSRTAYRHAAHIFSLFEANRRDQIADGALPERVTIIPNGIRINNFLKIEPRKRTRETPLVIGFIGRVASIKDVKTLVRALGILKQNNVSFEGLIMGPMEEEEEYAQECIALANSLDLKNTVEFTGPVQIFDYLPRLDVVVLSSISEGLPFTILEANAAGLPVASTDVGACRELIEGRSQEDRLLGPGGLVVPVASPNELAAALTRLEMDPALCARMGKAGRERVIRYYDLVDVMYQYQKQYERYFYANHFAGEQL